MRRSDEARPSRFSGHVRRSRVDHAVRWAQERGVLSVEDSQVSVNVLKVGYALDRSAALLVHAYRSRPMQASIDVWWTTKTLQRHRSGPIDWRLYTSGSVTEYTVAGDHMEAVQRIQVHQRIGEILDGLHTPTPLRTMPTRSS